MLFPNKIYKFKVGEHTISTVWRDQQDIPLLGSEKTNKQRPDLSRNSSWFIVHGSWFMVLSPPTHHRRPEVDPP